MKHPLLGNVLYTVMMVALSLPGLIWTIVQLLPTFPDFKPLWVAGAWLLVLMVVSRVFYQKLIVARPWFWMLMLMGLAYLIFLGLALLENHALLSFPAQIVFRFYPWLAIDMVVSCGVASCLWLHWCRQDFNTKYYCRLDGWCTRAYQPRSWKEQDRHVFMSYVMLIYHGIFVGYFVTLWLMNIWQNPENASLGVQIYQVAAIAYLVCSAVFWSVWAALSDPPRHILMYAIGIVIGLIFLAMLNAFHGYHGRAWFLGEGLVFLIVYGLWWATVMIWQYRKTHLLSC